MRSAAAKNELIRNQKKAKRIAYWKHYWVMYAMLALPVAYYIIFRYIPMAGNILAFRRYVPGKGMFGTEWTMRYVERFLKDPVFWKAFKNTLVLSLENLLINFPIPIIFAIALNELRWEPFKKFAQTASYIPRFVSTVVVIAILNEFLSPSSGFLNMLLKKFGMEPIYFMNEAAWFRPVYIFSEAWQFTGWNAIIFLAAITGVELLTGLLVNRDYHVWDYRTLPGNFKGQVCLPFSLLWIPVASLGMELYGLTEK